MNKQFFMVTKENLSGEDKETLFKAWLVVRQHKDMDLSLAEYLKQQGFSVLFSIKETEEK